MIVKSLRTFVWSSISFALLTFSSTNHLAMIEICFAILATHWFFHPDTQHLTTFITFNIDEGIIVSHRNIQTFPYRVLAVCVWHWSQVSSTSSSVQSVGHSSQIFGLSDAVDPDVRNASMNICVWIIAVDFVSFYFYLLCLLIHTELELSFIFNT